MAFQTDHPRKYTFAAKIEKSLIYSFSLPFFYFSNFLFLERKVYNKIERKLKAIANQGLEPIHFYTHLPEPQKSV